MGDKIKKKVSKKKKEQEDLFDYSQLED